MKVEDIIKNKGNDVHTIHAEAIENKYPV